MPKNHDRVNPPLRRVFPPLRRGFPPLRFCSCMIKLILRSCAAAHDRFFFLLHMSSCSCAWDPLFWAVAHECHFFLHMSSCSCISTPVYEQLLLSVICFFCTWVAAHAWVPPLYDQLLMNVMFSLHVSGRLCMNTPPLWAAVHECHFFCTLVAAHAWVPLYEQLLMSVFFLHMSSCSCMSTPIYEQMLMTFFFCTWVAAHS